MNIVPAREVYLIGGEEAVLLLHSFTSHTRDMKKLAQALHQKGFTSYAPLYKGHGYIPEELLNYTVDDWWNDALSAYQRLKEDGYQKVSVVGLSIGGIFALRLAEKFKLECVVILSVPFQQEAEGLRDRIVNYARNFKKLEGVLEEELAEAIQPFETMQLDSLARFTDFTHQTMRELEKVTTPIALYYGKKDHELYQESAYEIQKSVSSKQTIVKGFDNSKHLMTLGADQLVIQNEIIEFLRAHETAIGYKL